MLWSFSNIESKKAATQKGMSDKCYSYLNCRRRRIQGYPEIKKCFQREKKTANYSRNLMIESEI